MYVIEGIDKILRNIKNILTLLGISLKMNLVNLLLFKLTSK